MQDAGKGLLEVLQLVDSGINTDRSGSRGRMQSSWFWNSQKKSLSLATTTAKSGLSHPSGWYGGEACPAQARIRLCPTLQPTLAEVEWPAIMTSQLTHVAATA